jgi:hypothetical protein
MFELDIIAKIVEASIQLNLKITLMMTDFIGFQNYYLVYSNFCLVPQERSNSVMNQSYFFKYFDLII